MSEQDEQVYWVRLTEEEHADAAGPGGIGTPLWLRHKLQSARPEHPKRREALEELGKAALNMVPTYPNDWPRFVNVAHEVAFAEAWERLRALEGK